MPVPTDTRTERESTTVGPVGWIEKRVPKSLNTRPAIPNSFGRPVGKDSESEPT